MSYNAVNCEFNVNESIGILKEVFFFFLTQTWVKKGYGDGYG